MRTMLLLAFLFLFPAVLFAEAAAPPPAPAPAVSEYAQGQIDGKYYLLRLQWGKGATWYAYNEGWQRLQAFCTVLTPCEAKTRTITFAELKDACAVPDKTPPVLTVYIDDSFTLTDDEVGILRQYLQAGGFLIMDSRPDPMLKELVAQAMAKVLPDAPLKALSAKHAITRYIFALDSPGYGENILDKKNYGITLNDRLAVFYSMGNFAHLLERFKSDEIAYVTTQYQMMANVYFYALTKGHPESLPKLTPPSKPAPAGQ